MARPSKFTPDKKRQVALSVLRGELTIAEAGRRFAASETSVAQWRLSQTGPAQPASATPNATATSKASCDASHSSGC